MYDRRLHALRLAITLLFLAAAALTPAVARSSEAQSSEARPGPEVGTRPGQMFPDLSFPRLKDGALTRLSAFRGKKVLLIQFASW